MTEADLRNSTPSERSTANCAGNKPMLRSPMKFPGYALGFALGGFFDGILLHQILQWHHLLSGLDSSALSDVRLQILADGLFHAVMYVIGAAGLWLLWRARREFAENGGDSVLLSAALIGFGSWHLIDGVLSHWVLGLHRIKMDSDIPLTWDLVWFLGFGVLPILLGFRARSTGWPGPGTILGAVLSGLVFGGGLWNLFPTPGPAQLVVWFRPGTTPAEVFEAAAEVSANVIWSDRSGEVWALDLPVSARAVRLYQHGAIFMGTSFSAGCLSWSRAKA